jgi:hypothetical protein
MVSKKLTAIAVGALVLVATAISPALGGPSLKQLVKKEVAKQLKKKKRGPSGPAGAPGAQGPQGTAGTARAYGLISPAVHPTAASVFFSKGISAPVAHPSIGLYCVSAPGVDPDTTVAVVSAEAATTVSPEGNATAQYFNHGAGCAAGTFPVETWMFPNGTSDSTLSNSVGFTIVIP